MQISEWKKDFYGFHKSFYYQDKDKPLIACNIDLIKDTFLLRFSHIIHIYDYDNLHNTYYSTPEEAMQKADYFLNKLVKLIIFA